MMRICARLEPRISSTGAATSTRSPTNPRWRGSSPRPCSAARSRGRRSCSTPICTPVARPAAAASRGGRGASLLEPALFAFMLFSLPDNDAFSHKNGPHAQVPSIAAADRQLERLMHAAGGPDAFLEQYAVIVTSDHSQASVEERIRLDQAFADFDVAAPGSSRSIGAEVALSPAQRAAMIYALDPDNADEVVARAIAAVRELEGVDLILSFADGDMREAVVRSRRGELRFAPGGELADVRGGHWSVEGDLAALRAEIQDGRFLTTEYPDALARMWSVLNCSTAGDVLLSAAPGYEFVDWGGADHVGGGSHGSLHRSDSLGALLWCGTGPDSRRAREQWSLRDVKPMICDHFGLQSPDHVDSGPINDHPRLRSADNPPIQ